ncbi:MAG: IS110 family transposase [gamma proteobacterium symbiont of Bathyaustriella thionipta]|nr:IS110 family transposase [gamma proteobacterium symbiont of Bathyaustriella thionipta]MCU7952219.1 IS110 family transposase [gamma proteobacterium symbiont of Bathyaustriella thionipta]MCU7967831.1 IS110 family transposase [gamma proteobacterium symbiont of Bathyaustriella thionipta]
MAVVTTRSTPVIYRPTLACLFEQFKKLLEDIKFLDQQIKVMVKNHQACNELTQMEGVGPISALLLYATFGTGKAFKNSREFSAYIGLTPKQYSSGGKQNIVGISKHVANKRLRSVLIEGARAYIYRMKAVTTPKDRWLIAMIQRAGHGKAAVALANKNVRTAWAILTHGTCYDKSQDNELLTA